MKSEGLYISNAIMEKYTSCIDKSSSNLDNTYYDTNTNFKGLINNGIYKKGFSNISKALSDTIDTLRNSNRVNKAYMSTFSTLEDKGSSLADSIEVPMISCVDNKLSLLKKEYMTLYKEDGESVKDNKTDEVLYEDVYDEEHKDLKEMNTLYKEKEEDFDISIDAFDALLENIYKDIKGQVIDLDDNYNINMREISNIDDNKTKLVEFNDNHSIESKELKELNNSSTYNLELEDKYTLDKVNLEHINSLIEFDPLIEDKD